MAMKYKQLIGFALPLVFSIGIQAGSAEDFEKGSHAYFFNQDVFTAMQYLEPAAIDGHIDSQVLLAYILDKSNMQDQAFTWYTKAAETGDASGEYGLGLMLSADRGIEPDEKRAVELMNSAASKGHAQAMVWLADAYDRGRFGLEKDELKSAEWTDKAEQLMEAEKLAESDKSDKSAKSEK